MPTISLKTTITLALLAHSMLACSHPPGNNPVDGSPMDAPALPDAAVADAAVDAPMPIDAPIPDPGDVDILFVVDNSGSMIEEQNALATAFQSFLPALEATYGRVPDLHIGVVSTDMGAGPWVDTGCSATGDNGQLLMSPTCGVTDPFIRDIDMNGTRETNYAGALEDAFSCAVQLGTTGCGFEQTLESMRRALDGSNPENAGFLRDTAMLVIVILSDEDDCSVYDTAMFDTTQNDINDPLGPISSFRCFEFGVQCDPDTPRVPGPRSNCVPRNASPYMYGVQEYVDFLQNLKPPGRVFVATIQGDVTPVNVSLDVGTNYPRLDPSCISVNGEAAPGVRLQTLSAGFPNRSQVSPICGNLNTVMQDLGTTIGTILP